MEWEDHGTRAGTVPLFAPPLPPKITSISHEFLASWKIKRREYEAEMRARCRISGENYDNVTTTIKESFNADLLDTVKNKALPDIKALFKSKMRLNMTKSDVYARILDYFNEFGEIMRANGLTGCFAGNDGAREKCKRLIASLHPAALKAEATEHERQYQRLKVKKRDQSENKKEKFKAKSEPSVEMKKKRPFGSNSSRPPAPDAAPTKLSTKPKTSSGAKSPPSPCPKCQQMHWLRECPKATDSEKETLRKKLREANQAKRARLKRLGECLPVPGRKVTLNGVLELPYYPDSGSDYTVICRRHWEQRRTMDPSVVAEDLETPVMNQAFGSNWISANKKTKLHLLIHTAAGPVEPVNAVEVLVVEADDDEFIVGNDLLNVLGIDVDRQLEMLADRGDDETSGDSVGLEADDPPVTASEFSDANIFSAVEGLIARAVEKGFPLDKVEQLRTIVHAYDVWRLELRADPPANVPPLEVRLQDGARPTKCKPRKYPPHIRQFLRDFNSRLVELGLDYENPDSRWASPVLPVKKSADIMDLRQTTDYRGPNAVTETMAAVMPILSLVVENASGMEHFGLFDFLKGFWQLPLAEISQEFISYMTDEKIFTPRRVPQGCSDAAIYSQKTMENCFASLLYEHLLIWIDDLLLYAADIDTYLVKLAELFSLLNQFGSKLSAKKTSLYQTQVKWCGKVIDGQGIRHDPERIKSLRALPYPRSAGELQQFVCAINWMRSSIIDFARLDDPLQHKLDNALASTKRTRRVAVGIGIALNADERRAFDQVKDALANAAVLNFPDDEATTCLFTDASDVGQSTQLDRC
ncbi:hypothetical protein PF004_g17961 [Phytophthora fragariae]|uniref:Reverse transcriptase domain-containing protein n=1 Tax=Phytophthora fragariae TaxID=53985 RepID=A0A6A3J842_9STRA|nr:hypothetical protein PF011_g17937 [Phytophthora fragariae]KAE9204039.1 hypothetical protein PF004_g17961 [Phytophthora fragariae]